MASAQSEPSMDEILASIRRIISEEDDNQTSADAASEEPLTLDETTAEVVEGSAEPDMAEEPVVEDEAPHVSLVASDDEEPVAEVDATPEVVEEDPLDLAVEAAETFEVQEEPTVEMTEEVVVEEEVAAPAVEAPVAVAPSADHQDYAAVTAKAKLEAAGHAVSDSLVSEAVAQRAANAFGALDQNIRVSEAPSGEGRTMEDLVQEMLRPMVQQWLDSNLERIVEQKVEEEVQRIARRR